jgi:uncharacterized protein (TIGR03437 family)
MLLLPASLFFLPYFETTQAAASPLSVSSDQAGNVYVISGVSSSGNSTLFITRFDSAGNVIYRVTPAPLNIDYMQATAGSGGNLYVSVSGTPVGGGLEQGYLAKLDPSGNILFSVPIPVSYAQAPAIGPDGSIYLTGSAYPSQLQTTPGVWVSSAQATAGEPNAFVLKLSSNGQRIEYVTFLNNSSTLNPSAIVAGTAIAVDNAGHAFVAGTTNDPKFPVTTGGAPPSPAAFALELAADGSRLVYSTFLPAGDTPTAIQLDSSASAHLTVSTLGGASYLFGRSSITAISTETLSANAQVSNVLTLPLTSFLIPSDDTGLAAVPDGAGNFIVTGVTAPADLSTTESVFTRGQNFVAIVRGSDHAVLYSSRLPTGNGGIGVAADSAGGFFMLGGTASSYTLTHFVPGPTAQPALLGVANAANVVVGSGLAPGEIVSIYGSSIGPEQPLQGGFDSSGHLPISLGGTRVSVNGFPAPLLYADSQQINVVVPFEVAGSSTISVQVDSNGQTSNSALLPEQASDPAIWQQKGYAFAVNQDGTLNSAEHPAKPGWVETILVNGAGLLNPVPEDGLLAPAGIPTVAPISVEVRADSLFYGPDVVCRLLYAASAPGQVAGMVQINFKLPETNLLTPTTSLQLMVGLQTTTALLWTSTSN